MFQLLCLFILPECVVNLPPLKSSNSMSRNKGIERFLTALAKSGGLLSLIIEHFSKIQCFGHP